MKLEKAQVMDIVLHTADDFEIIIDFPWPTYPVLQYIVCRKNALIELTQLIGINVKIYLNSFADAAAFINWLDRFCGSIHQAGGEVIFHTKKVASTPHRKFPPRNSRPDTAVYWWLCRLLSGLCPPTHRICSARCRHR